MNKREAFSCHRRMSSLDCEVLTLLFSAPCHTVLGFILHTAHLQASHLVYSPSVLTAAKRKGRQCRKLPWLPPAVRQAHCQAHLSFILPCPSESAERLLLETAPSLSLWLLLGNLTQVPDFCVSLNVVFLLFKKQMLTCRKSLSALCSSQRRLC